MSNAYSTKRNASPHQKPQPIKPSHRSLQACKSLPFESHFRHRTDEVDAPRRVDEVETTNKALTRPGSRSGPGHGQAGPPIPSSRGESLTENTPLKRNEYYRLDRPIYFFAKIDEFFAGDRQTSTGTVTNCEPFPTLPNPTVPSTDVQSSTEPLSTDQHAYFLRLFWEAYHPLIHVPGLSVFRALYDSLWQETAEKREAQGALINCMTALGMQYGHGADLASRILELRVTGRQVTSDMSWAGFEYFRRCRDYMTLNADISLVGMQCYALMALYLLNASDFKSAYSMLGIAIRNAHGMNLHREPDEHTSPEQRDLHRRVWWLLFTLDVRCSLQIRKPVAVQASVTTCALPEDDGLGAGYFTHAVKLAIAVDNIYRLTSLFDMYSEASNIAVLEHRAATLSAALPHLESWRMELPPELLSPRRERQSSPSRSMSTAESPLLLELGVPTTLHRQRVLLEVHYHNAYIMLQRPFICFPPRFQLWPFSSAADRPAYPERSPTRYCYGYHHPRCLFKFRHPVWLARTSPTPTQCHCDHICVHTC